MTFGESTRPIDWSLTVGRRRTRQAAPTDDPLRMARCLLAGKAVAGIVELLKGRSQHAFQQFAPAFTGVHQRPRTDP